MSTPKHTITIEISADGQISGEVHGVKGTSCSDITKWLDELGEVKEDRHTPDYYQRETGQQIKVGK